MTHLGTLSANDLWQPYNGHRLIVPQTLMILMAGATSWHVGYELGLSVIFATLSFTIMATLCLRSAGLSLRKAP